MSLERLGYIELPENVKPGGFDHAAVHRASGKLYVAHTVNDAVDVIDSVHDRYSHSIKNLTGVAGALVSDEENLVFTSNEVRDPVSLLNSDDGRAAGYAYIL
jgi:DNA-binding beta-propeller fold protein YncE